MRVKELVRRAGRSSGLLKRYTAMGGKLLPHALRVAFAVQCLENGSGLFALHNLLGFPSIRTTEMVIELSVGLWLKPYDLAHPLATGRGLSGGGGKQSELSVEEVRLLIEAAGDGPRHTHNDLILRTIYAAGLRISELLGLLVADVELDGGRLTLSPHTFRHAHASHLYEGGIVSRYDQEAAGPQVGRGDDGLRSLRPAHWRAAYDRCRLLG